MTDVMLARGGSLIVRMWVLLTVRMVVERDWIDETYGEKLAAFAAERDISQDRVERIFREHCETFQATVIEDTSGDVVRRLALDKLQWHLSEETDDAED